jgi:hypothetical protein
MDQTNAMPLDREGFREVVRHPTAHSLVLGNYRLGEYAGVVALDLLGEMRPGGKEVMLDPSPTRAATRGATSAWRDAGATPKNAANSPEEFAAQRQLVGSHRHAPHRSSRASTPSGGRLDNHSIHPRASTAKRTATCSRASSTRRSSTSPTSRTSSSGR